MKWLFIPGLALLLAGCGADPAAGAEEGRLLLRQFGCGSCHRIPGVAAADGNVGPPLDGVGQRAYLGGVLPNTPENMARWIQEPTHFEPDTAMPDMQVTAAQARAMTVYLQELQ
jgi:cytochrome c